LRRAESVAAYLVTNFNIEKQRLVLQWFGALNPEASNTTAEGRALNRRVVIGINLAD
jgi:OOP family OmpA-OmpF porin